MIYDLTKRQSGGDYVAADWLDNTKPIGEISSDRSGALGGYRLYARTGITSLSLPNVTSLGEGFAWGCSNLESVYAPNITSIAGNSLRGTKLQYLILPKCGKISGQYPFHGGDNISGAGAYMKAVDLGGEYAGTSLAGYYMSCPSLYWDTLVLRSSVMWALGNVTAFTYSRFAKTTGGAGATGRGGTIYVPSALLSSYQSSTNWASLMSQNTNNQFKTIESTHTDPNAPIDLTLYYADGTPIPAAQGE